jgi:hypothetical protein
MPLQLLGAVGWKKALNPDIRIVAFAIPVIVRLPRASVRLIFISSLPDICDGSLDMTLRRIKEGF